MKQDQRLRFPIMVRKAAFVWLGSVVLCLGPGSRAPAAEDPDIAGRWMVEKKDGVVLIETKGENIVGRLVWVQDRDGILGAERLDAKNPNPDLRSRKILGMEILTGLPRSPRDGGWYGRGRIYNPKTGKSYNVRVKLEAPDRLKLKVGPSIFGYSTRWTRAE